MQRTRHLTLLRVDLRVRPSTYGKVVRPRWARLRDTGAEARGDGRSSVQLTHGMALTKSAGIRSVDEGVFSPMNLAMSATKASQLQVIAFQVGELARSCLMWAATDRYGSSLRITLQRAEMYSSWRSHLLAPVSAGAGKRCPSVKTSDLSPAGRRPAMGLSMLWPRALVRP